MTKARPGESDWNCGGKARGWHMGGRGGGDGDGGGMQGEEGGVGLSQSSIPCPGPFIPSFSSTCR